MDDYYWQLYFELEKEMDEIMFTISFNSDHKDVYSPRIADLIVRAGFQIESISQQISSRRRNSKAVNFKTNINEFNKTWLLEEKVVTIITNKIKSSDSSLLVLKPFSGLVDKEKYSSKGPLYSPIHDANSFSRNVPENERAKAFPWENAYNNLKHNFYNTISTYGTVFNLVQIMSALYLLNLYFDPGLYSRNGSWTYADTNVVTKSNIFSTFVAECFIVNHFIVIDDLPLKLSFDNCAFIRVKTIESVGNEIIERYGDDFELVDDYVRYQIPDQISDVINEIAPAKDYDFLIRNMMKKSDLICAPK